MQEFPACDDVQMWTKNTIDISIFHEKKENSNISNNSYIKEYLEKVVKVKMQVSSISLPWLKNKGVDIMDVGTASQYSNTQDKRDKLKWKKITDYTKDVQASYKTLRNIKINIVENESHTQHTWLGTRHPGSEYDSNVTYALQPPGGVDWYYTFYVFGLRPVITK